LLGWLVVVARPRDEDAFEESSFLVVWRLRRDRPPPGQEQAGCGEGVSVFFLVDGGALSQLGDEVCRWRGEHVEPSWVMVSSLPAGRPNSMASSRSSASK